MVTPTILTLASQPALGVTCYTPSRSLSKNTSKSQAGKDGMCSSAGSVANYKSGAIVWPTSAPQATLFHNIFSGSVYGTRSLLDVLNKTSTPTTMSDPFDVAAHLIAALLNIRGGNGAVIAANVLNEQGLKAIWTAWLGSNFTKYPVMAGTDWSGTQLTTYLKNNGIVG